MAVFKELHLYVGFPPQTPAVAPGYFLSLPDRTREVQQLLAQGTNPQSIVSWFSILIFYYFYLFAFNHLK